jgi:hypothetical protein
MLKVLNGPDFEYFAIQYGTYYSIKGDYKIMVEVYKNALNLVEDSPNTW